MIRLQRIGKKNEPSFRLALVDSHSAAKKGAMEILGFHNFRQDGTTFKKDRIEYWMSKGAQLSDTAHNLLVTAKIVSEKKRNVLPKKTVPVKAVEETPATASASVEAPAAEAAAPAEVPLAPAAEAVVAEPAPAETPAA